MRVVGHLVGNAAKYKRLDPAQSSTAHYYQIAVFLFRGSNDFVGRIPDFCSAVVGHSMVFQDSSSAANGVVLDLGYKLRFKSNLDGSFKSADIWCRLKYIKD